MRSSGARYAAPAGCWALLAASRARFSALLPFVRRSAAVLLAMSCVAAPHPSSRWATEEPVLGVAYQRRQRVKG